MEGEGEEDGVVKGLVEVQEVVEEGLVEVQEAVEALVEEVGVEEGLVLEEEEVGVVEGLEEVQEGVEEGLEEVGEDLLEGEVVGMGVEDLLEAEEALVVEVGEQGEEEVVVNVEETLIVQEKPPTAPSGATADQRLAMPMEGMVLQLILMLANVMSKLTVPSGLLTAQNLVFVKKLLSLVQMDLLDEV